MITGPGCGYRLERKFLVVIIVNLECVLKMKEDGRSWKTASFQAWFKFGEVLWEKLIEKEDNVQEYVQAVVVVGGQKAESNNNIMSGVVRDGEFGAGGDGDKKCRE